MPAAKQNANSVAAVQCGVDDSEGELEDKSSSTININDHKCNIAEDTEDNIGIIFDLEHNEVKVNLRDFGSYVKYNKECLHKGYKSGTVGTYLSAQPFAAPAVGQNKQKLAKMNKTGRFKKKTLKGNSCQL
jgi:hypothetical protein